MTYEVLRGGEKLPLISCIMPTYGRPQYVHESVKMFLDQDYPTKELVVLNDCAGQLFRCELPQVRVVNVSQRFATLGEKRNECIRQARGEYLAIWDDDDVYLPWRLSYSLEQLLRWGTDFYRPADFLAYWGEDFLHDNQVVPGWLSHPTALLRKGLWDRVGGYPARDVGEDAEFFARIHNHLDKEFIKYPIHSSDRFMILRGKSQYRHMSIGGGLDPLDTVAGDYHVLPRPIADVRLRSMFTRLIDAHAERQRPVDVNERTRHYEAPPPVLSVCISLKERSRVQHGEKELEPFPNCVRSLRAAAETAGPLELVVADFHSKDWPMGDWLARQSTDKFQIQCIPETGSFSRGRGLNTAARHATSDNLFLCDADILVSEAAIERGMAILKQGKASFPVCRYTHEDGRLAFWQDLGFGLTFVNRHILTAAGGVPEFNSWGGEDDLLRDRLRGFVGEVRRRDEGLVHQWHPDANRYANYRRNAKVDYDELRTQRTTRPRVSHRFSGQHPHWAGAIREIYLYENGRMERPGIDAGAYELEPGTRLVLRWDNWPPEVLEWDAESRQFRDPTKPFTLVEAGLIARASERKVAAAISEIRSQFCELAKHLTALAPFQFLSPPGNWGDAIIRSGTLAFLSQLGVQYIEIATAAEAKRNLPAVLGGSGGFCRFWQWSPRAAQQLCERSKELVVLPSSLEATAIRWYQGKNGCTIYAREHESFRQIQHKCPTFLCPDMAFWNDVSGYESTGAGTLNAFRTDSESLGLYQHHNDNRDLSVECDATGSAAAFYREIAKYSAVRTDRAHVAIASAMLGRQVTLYPNAYHKNEAIFNSSLKRFQVTWHPRFL